MKRRQEYSRSAGKIKAMSQTMQGRLIFDSCTSGVYIEEKVIKENLIKEEVRHF